MKFNELMNKNKKSAIKDSFVIKTILNGGNKFKNAKKLLFKIINEELSLKQKTILNLYYLEKLKMREISLMLNIRQPTISMHLIKANKKIRTILDYINFFNSS